MTALDRVRLAKRLSLYILGIGLPLIVLLFLFADRAVDTVVASWGLNAPTALAHLYTHFGDAIPWDFLVSGGLVYAVASEWRRGPTPSSRLVFFVCVSFALAVIFGDTLKYLFGRARPPLLLEQGVYGFTWFGTDNLHHSFPSGHTLRTFAAMTAISLRLPRLTWLFITLAALEAVSRVLVLKHYPSDVLFGAMIGALAALWTNAILAKAWE